MTIAKWRPTRQPAPPIGSTQLCRHARVGSDVASATGVRWGLLAQVALLALPFSPWLRTFQNSARVFG